MKGEPLNILLVEDNPDHAELIKRNFEDCLIVNRFLHVEDGEAALDYLHARGKYADSLLFPRPHIVLLDLRLPKIDGLEVLKQIKNHPDLRVLPTIILTTSDAERDLAKAYEYHANSYLTKPVGFPEFSQLLRDLGFYWLAWNRRPW
jgi:CheY-like chemotaxis protein